MVKKRDAALLPFAGLGHALRFSTRLIPSMMRTAYDPVHVKAEVIILQLSRGVVIETTASAYWPPPHEEVTVS